MLVNDLLDGLPAYLSCVADRDKLDVFLLQHPLQVKLTACPEANASQHDAFARCDRTAAAQRGGGDDRRHEAGRTGRGRRLERLPAVELLRGRSRSRHGDGLREVTLGYEHRRRPAHFLRRTPANLCAGLAPAITLWRSCCFQP